MRAVDPDDRLSLADACQLLAIAHMRPAQHERALELFDEAVALNAGRDDGWSRAVGASAAGLAAGLRGDLQAALEHHLASMEHFEAIGAEWAVANVGSDIAQVVEARGDLDAAVAFTERAMLAARRLNLQLAEIQLGARLGNLLLCQGDVEGADAPPRGGAGPRRVGGLAGQLRRDLHRPSDGAVGPGPAPGGRRRRGRRPGGLPAHPAAVRPGAVARAAGLRDRTAGRRLTCRGAPHRGARHSRQLGDERLVALALEGLAGVAVARGDHEHGAALLGLAGHLRDLNGAPSGPASDEVRIGEEILEALGPERFDEAPASGRDADIDALVQ